MDKKKFTVKIEDAECKEMQKLWYEYNATINNISFLMSQKGVERDVLQEYIDTSEQRWLKQQMLKEKLAAKYRPDEVDLKNYNYGFEFDECELWFEEA